MCILTRLKSAHERERERERERESINNSLICKLLEEFFIRKTTPKNGIKQKPVPPGADADIPWYAFAFLVILL